MYIPPLKIFSTLILLLFATRVRGNLWIQDVEEENEEDFCMKTNEIRQYIDEKSVGYIKI